MESAGSIPESRRREITRQVSQFVAELLAINPLAPDFSERTAVICAIGAREVEQLAHASLRAMARFDHAHRSDVPAALGGLRAIASRIDPRRKGGPLNPARAFGLFARQSDSASYFAAFPAMQDAIITALAVLERDRDAMLRENVMLEAERAHLHAGMVRLEEALLQAGKLAQQLDSLDPQRGHPLRMYALPEALDRARELTTQMALARQAWLTLHLVEGGNVKLIEASGAVRAQMLKVLRVASHASMAMTSKALVLERIAALEAATSRLADPDAEKTSDPAAALASAFADLSSAIDEACVLRESAASELITNG